MRCYNKTVLVRIIQIGVDIMKKNYIIDHGFSDGCANTGSSR